MQLKMVACFFYIIEVLIYMHMLGSIYTLGYNFYIVCRDGEICQTISQYKNYKNCKVA